MTPHGKAGYGELVRIFGDHNVREINHGGTRFYELVVDLPPTQWTEDKDRNHEIATELSVFTHECRDMYADVLQKLGFDPKPYNAYTRRGLYYLKCEDIEKPEAIATLKELEAAQVTCLPDILIKQEVANPPPEEGHDKREDALHKLGETTGVNWKMDTGPAGPVFRTCMTVVRPDSAAYKIGDAAGDVSFFKPLGKDEGYVTIPATPEMTEKLTHLHGEFKDYFKSPHMAVAK